MRKWLCTVALYCLVCHSAAADDAVARRLFDEGVGAAAHGVWQEAVDKFEASLGESDKPATHFNLALAYHALGQPLPLTRHALAFLSSPPNPAREQARAKAEALLAEALPQLAVLDLSGAPEGTSLRIVQGSPAVVDAPRHYVLPGRTVLEIQSLANTAMRSEWLLVPGQVVRWAELARDDSAGPTAAPATSAASAAAENAASMPRLAASDAAQPIAWRRSAAWSAGTLGAALFVAAGATFGVTAKRADEFAAAGVDGTSEPGHLDDVERYQAGFHAIMPLALVGGALAASAIPLAPPRTLRGALGWSIGALTVGTALLLAGTYLLIREPDMAVESSGIERPSRQAGSLLFGAALPPLTGGVTLLLRRQRRVHVALRGSGASLRW